MSVTNTGRTVTVLAKLTQHPTERYPLSISARANALACSSAASLVRAGRNLAKDRTSVSLTCRLCLRTLRHQ